MIAWKKNSVWLQESEAEIEDEVDILMSSDIVAAQMSTKNISFCRAQSGWLFKEDKSVRFLSGIHPDEVCALTRISVPVINFLDSQQELVGAFQSDYYVIHGLSLESRKR